MHPSALLNASRFFNTYISSSMTPTVMDIGAQNVNGSIKDVIPLSAKYIGVDFVAGKGVDKVITDPYVLPFADESIDIAVSSSCFEHSEMFWLLFLEIMRVLKPDGLLYLNVPSNGMFHRYPVDCWRFYPDSGQALVTWGKRNGLNSLLLESYISKKYMGLWNDYVAIFLKDEMFKSKHPNRIVERSTDFINGSVAGSSTILKFNEHSQDQRRLVDKVYRYYWGKYEKAVLKKIATASGDK